MANLRGWNCSGYAAPDIFAWNFVDGTGGPLFGPPDYKFWTYFPDDEQIVADGTFPSAIDSTGYSGRIHYVIPEFTGTDNQDINRSFDLFPMSMGAPANALDHFFIRQWVKIGTPLDTSFTIQRKLIYIRSDFDINNTWSVIVTGFAAPGATGAPVKFVVQDPASGMDTYNLNPPAYSIPWNTWKGIEVEVFANTPGVTDGRLRLWIYGDTGATELDAEFTGLNIRGLETNYLQLIQYGNQADRILDGQHIDEYRNVNRLALSTQRIGP